MPFPAECPVCRGPLRWTYILRPVTTRWQCRHCDSLLTIHIRRRLLGVAVYVPAALAIYFAVRGAGPYADALFLLCLVLLLFIVVGAFDRAVAVERCGFYCRGCGYDLRGQVVPRCPECGHEFDEDERKILETGVLPQARLRAGRPWVMIGLLVLLGAFVTAGLILNVRAAKRAGRPTSQPTAAPVVAQPADSP